MKVAEAEQLVLDLIARDVAGSPLGATLVPGSPDGDAGTFVLDGRVARAIHHFDGWYVPINLSWFRGGFDPPEIKQGSFHWYAFAIPRRGRLERPHYLICDYLQMREWVLDFAAPLGRDHRDHRSWRADLKIFPEDPDERIGYFRWGDEPVGSIPHPSRVFEVDNASTLADAAAVPMHVGVFGPGGESTAHRQLKLFVATHGSDFGMSERARALVEHRFRTGDRVDVMFQNHEPERTVVEIEISGEENVCTGIHQAVKYRSLAEVEGGCERLSPTVRSLVVAYDTAYPSAVALSDRYEVGFDLGRSKAGARRRDVNRVLGTMPPRSAAFRRSRVATSSEPRHEVVLLVGLELPPAAMRSHPRRSTSAGVPTGIARHRARRPYPPRRPTDAPRVQWRL